MNPSCHILFCENLPFTPRKIKIFFVLFLENKSVVQKGANVAATAAAVVNISVIECGQN